MTGFNSVPGEAWPGAAWPGQPPGTATTVSYLYGGTLQVTYIAYIDTGAGHTLLASPGGVYQIAAAGQGYDYGSTVPPQDGMWTIESD